jgi:hypothetical protein
MGPRAPPHYLSSYTTFHPPYERIVVNTCYEGVQPYTKVPWISVDKVLK